MIMIIVLWVFLFAFHSFVSGEDNLLDCSALNRHGYESADRPCGDCLPGFEGHNMASSTRCNNATETEQRCHNLHREIIRNYESSGKTICPNCIQGFEGKIDSDTICRNATETIKNCNNELHRKADYRSDGTIVCSDCLTGFKGGENTNNPCFEIPTLIKSTSENTALGFAIFAFVLVIIAILAGFGVIYYMHTQFKMSAKNVKELKENVEKLESFVDHLIGYKGIHSLDENKTNIRTNENWKRKELAKLFAERVENRNHDHLVQPGAEARTSEEEHEHLGEGAPAGSVMAFKHPLNSEECDPFLA